MTLQQIKFALTKVDLKSPMFRISGNGAAGLIKCRQRIDQLASLGVMPTAIEALRKGPVFNVVGNELQYDFANLSLILEAAEDIRRGALGLLDTIDSLVPPEEPTSIAIKLPDTSDLGYIISCLSSIEKSITNNICSSEINGRLTLRSWQPGSLWIYIALGTEAALRLVSGIAWGAAVVSKKRAEAKLMSTLGDSLQIKNELMRTLLSGIEAHLDLVVEAEAMNLYSKNFSGSENQEQIERLKMGIREWSGLIDKGTQIHPSLLAPEELKNLIPDVTKLGLIESKQKLIQDQDSEGDSQRQQPD